MEINVKINKPIDEKADSPTYEVFMESKYDSLAQKYLVAVFMTGQRIRISTQLN